MKVLLIWPNSRNEVLGWGDLGAIAEPLSLEYLGAALGLDGHKVQILDLRLHPQDLVTTLETFRPDLVGVTAFTMHVRTVLEICNTVKNLRQATRIFVGGHHATFLPEDFFVDSIDFVISGEGTGAVRIIAESVEDGKQCQPTDGVWSRVNGEFTCLGQSRTMSRKDFNELVVPDRSLTQDDRHRYFIDWMKPVALLRTSAGCPFRCSFCSIWKAMDGRYLIRTTDPVVEELRSIKEEWVFLVDDEAFINRQRMLELAGAIRAAGIRKRFFTYCRIDTLLRNRDAIAAWRGIGLERLFVGIDAISSKDLTEYNKRFEIASIESGLRLAKQLGIEIFAQFVVNTDYTTRDFERLIRFIDHHNINYPSFTILTPLPGTEMLQNFDEIIEWQPNGRPNWDLFDLQNAVTATRLPKVEFRHQYRSLYKVFKGSYAQYREHNTLVSEQSPRLASCL